MRLKKIAQILLIAAGIMAVSGCTHTRKNTDPNAGNSYDDPYSKAQTSGARSGSNYVDGVGGNLASSKNVYYFDFDKSVVRANDRQDLYAKADYLVAHPKAKIILEGHTDPRGSREYNVGLGERRAAAISEILQARGVRPDQIRMVSYGAQHLASQGRSEADYQKDRRAIYAHIQKG